MSDTSDTSATSPDLSGSTETHEDQSLTVCYLCRQRKTKCDRKLPSCGFCLKAKVNCRYVAQPKKRGLRAGYVSELEARLGMCSLVPSQSDMAADVLVMRPLTALVPIVTPASSPALLLHP